MYQQAGHIQSYARGTRTRAAVVRCTRIRPGTTPEPLRVRPSHSRKPELPTPTGCHTLWSRLDRAPTRPAGPPFHASSRRKAAAVASHDVRNQVPVTRHSGGKSSLARHRVRTPQRRLPRRPQRHAGRSDLRPPPAPRSLGRDTVLHPATKTNRTAYASDSAGPGSTGLKGNSATHLDQLESARHQPFVGRTDVRHPEMPKPAPACTTRGNHHRGSAAMPLTETNSPRSVVILQRDGRGRVRS